jgi:thioredoxin reductase (NADPH)
MAEKRSAEVIIVGGGLAGLSAAIYLGRANRRTLLIDSGHSMARWEPDVQNYLGFPDGIEGCELLRRAREQAKKYRVSFLRDEIVAARRRDGPFHLRGRRNRYTCERLLLATGIFHIPPDIPGIKPCLGHSMFFCKDCDGVRVRGKNVGIYGWTNETVEYALAMLFYSPRVAIVTDGRAPRWDRQHAGWVAEYQIPVHPQPIKRARRSGRRLLALALGDASEVVVDALFTTRGDIYFTGLAKTLGARINDEGEIVVGLDMRTTVKGLYAAGCVTPANCQMIIAAGQGATAAQAINRDLFDANLATHSLRRFRIKQLRRQPTRLAVRPVRKD